MLASGENETPQDFGEGPEAAARRWATEIDLAEKAFAPWTTRAQKIIKRYADDINSETDGNFKAKQRRVAILWSNVNTLAPALYAAPPKPQIERRFRDADPVGRAAAQVLERATSFALEMGQDFDGAARACVTDYLLTGRGCLWLRYNPHFRTVTPRVPLFPAPVPPPEDGYQIGGDATTEVDAEPLAPPALPAWMTPAGAPAEPGMVRFGDDDGAPYIDGEPYEEIEREEVLADHVHWSDFLHSPGRDWSEVRWVARRVFMTRAELIERFGEEAGRAVKLDYTPSNAPETADGERHQAFKKATVWEIWDKSGKKAVWFAPGLRDRLLDERPDPLGLSGFFPCPPPLYATLSGDSLSPIPDYVYYQGDAEALDTLAQRIASLQESIRVVGLYDKANSGVARLLQGGENEMIAVDQWAMHAQSGGVKGAVDWLPIGEIVGVLNQLYAAEKAAKDRIYEITGISDILRGQGVASETATAQGIKARYAGLRLSARQQAVARLLRDAVRIAAEIVGEKFSDETLMQAAGVAQMGPDGRMIAEALALLRQDGPRGFRLDIETDSTIAADEQEEKRSVTEFLGAVGQFISQSLPAMQAAPQLGPMLGEMLTFGARRYRAGRGMEAAIEQAVDALGQAAAQRQAQPQPGAAQRPDQKEQAAAQKTMLDMQERQQRLQADIAEQQARAQTDIRIAQEKAAADIQIATTKAQHQLQAEAMKAAAKTGVVYPMLQGYGDIRYA
jgi:hypothetical protein